MFVHVDILENEAKKKKKKKGIRKWKKRRKRSRKRRGGGEGGHNLTKFQVRKITINVFLTVRQNVGFA